MYTLLLLGISVVHKSWFGIEYTDPNSVGLQQQWTTVSYQQLLVYDA